MLAFFDERRRELPWRETSDPYRILVSEIMLQQTRVETVVPYYRRWVQRFPDPASLAEADEEEVLRHWQGLGYYRRARNLQAAAREIVEQWGGDVPGDAKALASLPGVGPYTAGAVGSIAFGQVVPAVDGNVRRVMARLMDDPAPGAALLTREVSRLVDPHRPGDFNQALMELGATVCTPRSPDCPVCPVAEVCRARAAGTQAERPRPPGKREIPHRVEAVAVVVRPGPGRWEVLLRRRPVSGLLGGMWECPGVDVGAHGSAVEEASVVEGAFSVASHALLLRPPEGPSGSRGPVDGERSSSDETTRPHATPRSPTPAPPLRPSLDLDLSPGLSLDLVLPAVDHVFSHRHVTYRPVRFRAPAGRPAAEPFRWVGFDALDPLPIPRAQGRILGGAEPEEGV
jgi:A/G-specific adenine glycosylase